MSGNGCNTRIIPRLDIKGPNLVKGVQFEGLRVLGNPDVFARRYYEAGADELLYIDSVASLYGRNNLLEIVKKAAENIYIPLTVGGGVRTPDDIHDLLRAGADKVAINTAALKNPKLIYEAARTFGSQCIVLSVQAIKRENGKYECLTDNARERTDKDVREWVREAVDLGAGEVLLTSVDLDGTGRGFDVELTAAVSAAVHVPVIASGGAGRKEHVLEVLTKGRADAVCVGSLFHYGILESVTAGASQQAEGNLDFLQKSMERNLYERKNIEPVELPELKGFLTASGVPCRHV